MSRLDSNPANTEHAPATAKTTLSVLANIITCLKFVKKKDFALNSIAASMKLENSTTLQHGVTTPMQIRRKTDTWISFPHQAATYARWLLSL